MGRQGTHRRGFGMGGKRTSSAKRVQCCASSKSVIPLSQRLLSGLLLIFWPPPKQAGEESMRQTRLVELRGGAEERYCEERRELETYEFDSAGPYRLWGFLILILGPLTLLL